MEVLTIGTAIPSATYSPATLSANGNFLVDLLGFYIVDINGDYINLGGGIDRGADTRDTTYTNGTIPVGSYAGGSGVTSVSWSAGD